MTSCPKCGAEVTAQATACPACGTVLGQPKERHHNWLSGLYSHVPHPHISHRKRNPPKVRPEKPNSTNPFVRFNKFIGVKITDAVGTMWCAYLFAALALVSLPEAIKGGTALLVAWIAQTFIQLVLLSIIMVGQKIAGEATDKRAIDTYNDAEAVLHEALQIQEHLAAQDAFLKRLIEELIERTPAGAPAAAATAAAPTA